MKMNKSVIRHACYIFLLVLAFAGCKEQKKTITDVEDSLKYVYTRLCLSKNGLEYPGEEQLKSWKKEHQPFSKTYLLVQDAKNELMAKIKANPERVLAYTLDTIDTACGYSDEDRKAMEDSAALTIESECLGALTALYYFNEPDQDKVIINRLLKASPVVLGRITDVDWFEWHCNRPNPQVWVEAIKEIPDDQIGRDLKEGLLWNFETVLDPDSQLNRMKMKFGVMLLD